MIHCSGGERRGAERVLRQHQRGPHPDRRQRHRHLRGEHSRQEATLGRLKDRHSSFTSRTRPTLIIVEFFLLYSLSF